MDTQKKQEEINELDRELLSIFSKRMQLVAEADGGLCKSDQKAVTDSVDGSIRDYSHVLCSMLDELSLAYRGKLNRGSNELYTKVSSAISETAGAFPKGATVACQGVSGSYSQMACEKAFAHPDIIFFRSFESVFTAIEKGLCEYGILPIENSTAGSVNQVYDLMIKRDFYIVKSIRVKISHNLLAKRGAALSDITEIYSHEQAINQCGEFLAGLTNVKVTCVENTAVAAKLVAESDRTDIAAICSSACADIYGLECLSRSVQDTGNNHTRFICISRKLEIYPGADKTTVMMILPHKPGSLYKVLARIYALGINLIKLESRPIPDSDFEFMFYFDLETSVYSEEYAQLIVELDTICSEFKYLGSYIESV